MPTSAGIAHRFNPHPPLRADAISPLRLSPEPLRRRFNPHPPLRADAITRRPRSSGAQVSILTRPYGRMLLGKRSRNRRRGQVSILTRPYGRMLWQSSRPSSICLTFQSSPALTGGCYHWHCRKYSAGTRFNPHPPLRADAMAAMSGLTARMMVSILTRPYGRMLCGSSAVHPSGQVFQSSPALTGGCYRAGSPDCPRSHGVSILTRPYGRMLSSASRS